MLPTVVEALVKIAVLTAALLVFAVIPFGTLDLGFEGLRAIRLVVAPGVDVGVVYLLAVGGIAAHGVVLGGWARNDEDRLIAGLRTGARLVSYQIPLGVAMVGVVLTAGSLRLDRIVLQQAQSGAWNVLVQPLGFFVFAVAAFVGAGGLPCDLPGPEPEWAAGDRTESWRIRRMASRAGAYLPMITASLLIVVLFLGGWHLWGLPDGGEVVVDGKLVQGAWWPVAILRMMVLLAKVLAVMGLWMVARRNWPHFRFELLTETAWKLMLPLGLVNVVVVATWIEYVGRPADSAVAMGACGWAVLVAAWLVVSWAVPAEPGETP